MEVVILDCFCLGQLSRECVLNYYIKAVAPRLPIIFRQFEFSTPESGIRGANCSISTEQAYLKSELLKLN